jgi:hypothetical protein
MRQAEDFLSISGKMMGITGALGWPDLSCDYHVLTESEAPR